MEGGTGTATQGVCSASEGMDLPHSFECHEDVFTNVVDAFICAGLCVAAGKSSSAGRWTLSSLQCPPR